MSRMGPLKVYVPLTARLEENCIGRTDDLFADSSSWNSSSLDLLAGRMTLLDTDRVSSGCRSAELLAHRGTPHPDRGSRILKPLPSRRDRGERLADRPEDRGMHSGEEANHAGRVRETNIRRPMIHHLSLKNR